MEFFYLWNILILVVEVSNVESFISVLVGNGLNFSVLIILVIFPWYYLSPSSYDLRLLLPVPLLLWAGSGLSVWQPEFSEVICIALVGIGCRSKHWADITALIFMMTFYDPYDL